MGINHLYWYALSFMLCGLYSHSHFHSWPDKGWAPHKGFRNKWRDHPETKAKAAANKAAYDEEKHYWELAHIAKEYEEKVAEADRKAYDAQRRARKRGESERERERRKRKERQREEELEEELQHRRRRVERKHARHLRRKQEFEEQQQRELQPKPVKDETLERAREAARRRERERQRERDAGVEAGDERASVGAHPRKRRARSRAEQDGPSTENEEEESTTLDGPGSTNETSLDREDNEGKVGIVLDSNGLPQISIGSSSDDEQQDALLLGGSSLPPRPSSAHSSDHEYDTPLPASVREELLSTTNADTASSPNKKPFSLLMAFCRNNDILLALIPYLPLPSLISLYSISKTFHYLFNRHHTAFILSSMRTWAPNADTIYPWRCYKSLCTNDPLLRQKMKYRGLDEEEAVFRLGKRGRDLRDVPTLRWLQMVVWREGVSKDCLVMLATKGLRCPAGTLDAVKRMWFLMDLPLNSQRIALLHNTTYIPNHTIYGMTAFLLKFDMAFTDPNQAAYPAQYPGMPATYANNIPTGVPLRKLLLAERHLTSLWRVLRGWTWDPTKARVPMTKLEALRLWVRHKFRMPEDAPAEVKQMSVMGVPWYDIGTAGLERTGVAFFNLNGKTTPVTHPAIMSPAATETHLGKQLLYPHRRVIHLPRVLEKPREPLSRPDELVLKEGVRRQMKMHQEWVHMMLWGFCDEVGFNWPVFDEGQYGQMDRGEMNVVEVLQEKQRVLRERARKEMEREVDEVGGA